ncbi:MAG: PorP/SprF family type IX secretion system membrane protein [Bacteroidota bacterium]
MKKLLILLSFFASLSTLRAQEEAVFVHYTINPLLINPAAAGFDEAHHNLFMNLRASWTGFSGTPRNYSINYNGPIGKNLGIGAMVFSENIASLTRTRAQLSYAFRFQAKDFKISAGVSTEFHRLRLDNVAANSATPGLYDPSDEAMEELMDGQSNFDASLGVYGSFQDQIFFGLSAPSLVRNRLDDIEGLDTELNFLVNLGGKFGTADSKVILQPSVLLKQVRYSPMLADLNLLVSFLKEQLITGLSYRGGSGGALGLTLGTKYNALQLMYSFDVFLGDFQQYNTGSHEVSINFAFDRKVGQFDRSKKYRK